MHGKKKTMCVARAIPTPNPKRIGSHPGHKTIQRESFIDNSINNSYRGSYRITRLKVLYAMAFEQGYKHICT